MSSVVRSVLGAALLLTGASAAMAASGNPPVLYQPVQPSASTATTASNNAPVAGQTVQPAASTATAASNNAASVDQKARNPSVSDRTDRYGGNDPNSVAGTRAFWDGMNPY